MPTALTVDLHGLIDPTGASQGVNALQRRQFFDLEIFFWRGFHDVIVG